MHQETEEMTDTGEAVAWDRWQEAIERYRELEGATIDDAGTGSAYTAARVARDAAIKAKADYLAAHGSKGAHLLAYQEHQAVARQRAKDGLSSE